MGGIAGCDGGDGGRMRRDMEWMDEEDKHLPKHEPFRDLTGSRYERIMQWLCDRHLLLPGMYSWFLMRKCRTCGDRRLDHVNFCG